MIATTSEAEGVPLTTQATKRNLTAAALLALLIATDPPARGQDLVRKWTGSTANDHFGKQVGWAGDVNGDGFIDIAIQAPYDCSGSSTCGMLEIVSGADGAELYRLYGDGAGYQFGEIGGPFGDVNGDGFDDILTSETIASYRRRIFAFSGKDGSTLWTLDGTSSDTLSGHYCGMGDVDGDGVPDFAVASGDANGAFVDVISGATRSPIRKLQGTDPSSTYFGRSLLCPGDLDGDGVSDLLVIENSCYYSSEQYDYAFSGRTGALIWQAPGPDCAGGRAPTAIGDINGDGIVDWAMGWSYRPVSGNWIDADVECFSGADGSFLLRVQNPNFWWYGGGSFGRAIAAAGDVNGDGTPDFAASENSFADDPGGDVYFYSGIDGAFLFHAGGTYKSYDFGVSLVGGLDVAHDGRTNLVVGDDLDTSAGVVAGAASLMRIEPIVLDAYPHFWPVQTQITVLGGPPHNPFAMFLVDWGGTPMFDLVAFSTFDASHRWQKTWTVPTGFSGIDVVLRAYAIDASGRLVVSNDETIKMP